jgi:hypothetical protein
MSTPPNPSSPPAPEDGQGSGGLVKPSPRDEQWKERVQEIFSQALERTPSGRAAFVAEPSRGDAELRLRVQQLLDAHERAGTVFDRALDPAIELELARLKPEGAGDRIGRYKLLQEIGQGGFGTVWMAEQLEPVSRRVALKIIKIGMDTKEVIGRFEQERQALAMMDHPNIAKVFDAGATQFGRPFFVMELVKGMPITQYCDEARLGTRERLALFGDVCSAINHAHQKGIIHRDIKPSNVDGHPPWRNGCCEGHRLRHRKGHSGPSHRQDAVHAIRAVHRHAGLHEPGAGHDERARYRYSQ